MNNAHQIRLVAVTTLALLLAPTTEAGMKEDVERALGARWFSIEMIVFTRPTVAPGGETLLRSEPRSWPAALEDRGPAPSADGAGSDDYPGCFGLDPIREASAWMSTGRPMTAIDAYFDEETDLLARSPTSTEDRNPRPDRRQDTTASEDQTRVGEAEPPPIALPPKIFENAIATLAQSLDADSYALRDDYALGKQYLALRYNRAYQPLLHQRWLQPVPPRTQPAPLMVDLALDDGWRLHGHVSVTVGRYLHFAPHLWLVKPMNPPPSTASDLAEPPQLPGSPTLDERLTLNDEAVALPDERAVAEREYYLLSESRRMRSTELHYLDHPKFGVLVRIDPLEIPESVNESWQALQAFEEALQ